MNQVEISVIVAMYNLKKYIKRCLNSLIKQDIKKPFEIIVIDNGSSDGCGKIVEAYCRKYPMIKLIQQENQGVSGARKTGIKHAKGACIVFVDGDDFVAPQYLSRLYENMLQNQSDIACCGYYNYFESNQKAMKCLLLHSKQVLSKEEALKQLLHDLTIRSYLWNKMFKRHLFMHEDTQFDKLQYFEDFALMPKLFYYANKVSFIEDCMYYYVQRSGSAMHTASYEKLMQYVTALKMIKTFLVDKQIYNQYEWDFKFLSSKVALSLIMMGISNVKPLIKQIYES